jgi:hypothetical protein
MLFLSDLDRSVVCIDGVTVGGRSVDGSTMDGRTIDGKPVDGGGQGRKDKLPRPALVCALVPAPLNVPRRLEFADPSSALVPADSFHAAAQKTW